MGWRFATAAGLFAGEGFEGASGSGLDWADWAGIVGSGAVCSRVTSLAGLSSRRPLKEA